MTLLITQFVKKNYCCLKPADNSNKAKEKKKVPMTVNCPASSEKVIAHANKTTHP